MINPSATLGISSAIVLMCLASPAPAQQSIRLPPNDASLSIGIRPAFTVGSEDGREEEAFGGVADVAFDAAENLYVLDRLSARVVMFDSLGRFVRAFGKRGGGPGEFNLPQHMTTTASGEVAVSDIGHRAVILFGADGRFRRTLPFAGPSVLIGGTFARHPQGGVVSRSMGNPASRDIGAFGDEVILWYPDRGAAPRPILTLRSARARRGNGSSMRMVQPPVFSPVPRFAVLPTGGLAFVDSAAYRIKIVSPEGRVYRVLDRPIAPRRVTAADREMERRRQEAQLAPGRFSVVGPQGGPLPPSLQGTVARSLRNDQFAPVIPVIQGLTIDPAGNLWIERSGPAAGRPGPIDVVTPQGRYLGTLRGAKLPAAFSAGGRAAYVETDGQGVDRVIVVRINPLPR
jgi:hypothetical protein